MSLTLRFGDVNAAKWADWLFVRGESECEMIKTVKKCTKEHEHIPATNKQVSRKIQKLGLWHPFEYAYVSVETNICIQVCIANGNKGTALTIDV